MLYSTKKRLAGLFLRVAALLWIFCVLSVIAGCGGGGGDEEDESRSPYCTQQPEMCK